MKRYGLAVAVLLLLSVNALVLAGVIYNRSGTPEATIVLTERELPLAYNYRSEENTGVALRLNWNQQDWKWDWFDRDKLAELGFDDVPELSEQRDGYYKHLPVNAYVVLEYEGLAWEKFRQEQLSRINNLPAQIASGKLDAEAAERQKKEFETSLRLASRLFAVDVGSDPETLRRHYPDTGRHLIMPAKVRASVSWETKSDGRESERRLHGRIEQVLAQTIHVPRQHHGILEKLPWDERLNAGSYYFNADDKRLIHYQVRLSLGKRHEPWIESIEAI